MISHKKEKIARKKSIVDTQQAKVIARKKLIYRVRHSKCLYSYKINSIYIILQVDAMF